MDWMIDLKAGEPVTNSTIKEIICTTPETPPVAKTKPLGSAGVVKQAKPKAKITAEVAATKKLAR